VQLAADFQGLREDLRASQATLLETQQKLQQQDDQLIQEVQQLQLQGLHAAATGQQQEQQQRQQSFRRCRARRGGRRARGRKSAQQYVTDEGDLGTPAANGS
jgi:DNA repair exonuclease SbcCD ATPase subunit